MTDNTEKEVQNTVNMIVGLLSKASQRGYIGEEGISQLEHALEAAYFASLYDKDDDEFILACLLHDIGHLCVTETEDNSMNGLGIKNHEQIGSKFLRKLGFSEQVCTLVAGHVNAKRYLITKTSDYLQSISEASCKTLQFQGGPMSGTEIQAFESNPFFEKILQLRKCDEQAKIPTENLSFILPDLDYYKSLLYKHLSR